MDSYLPLSSETNRIMQNNKSLMAVGLVALMVFLAAITRILPHQPNFTAVGAMALFGAAHFKQRWMAVVIPFAALYLSDLFLNNVIYAQYFDGFTMQIAPFVYLAFALVLGIGFFLRSKVSTKNVAVAALASAVVFFLVTNAAAWWTDPMYTKDLSGLMTSYIAGIPFFSGTLAGNVVYSAVLFGTYAWMQKRYPQLAMAA